MQITILFDPTKVTLEQVDYMKNKLMKTYYVRADSCSLQNNSMHLLTANIPNNKSYNELLDFVNTILFDLLYHKSGIYPNYKKDSIQVISINIIF
jgi:hypothetical protein